MATAPVETPMTQKDIDLLCRDYNLSWHGFAISGQGQFCATLTDKRLNEEVAKDFGQTKMEAVGKALRKIIAARGLPKRPMTDIESANERIKKLEDMLAKLSERLDPPVAKTAEPSVSKSDEPEPEADTPPKRGPGRPRKNLVDTTIQAAV